MNYCYHVRRLIINDLSFVNVTGVNFQARKFQISQIRYRLHYWMEYQCLCIILHVIITMSVLEFWVKQPTLNLTSLGYGQIAVKEH